MKMTNIFQKHQKHFQSVLNTFMQNHEIYYKTMEAIEKVPIYSRKYLEKSQTFSKFKKRYYFIN